MKTCVIKLGAKGDVIRTLPVIKEIKNKYPGSTLTLITKENIKDLLTNLDFINKIQTIPLTANEKFDILYNLDIEDEATSLVEKINAKEKFGFRNEGGFVSALNFGAEYYLNTLFDDEIKKTNKKTYQEMMFEASEIPPTKELTQIKLTDEDTSYANSFLEENKINKKNLIGIHMGASPRWPSKIWHEDNLKEFIKKAKDKGYEILIFGGPDEVERLNNFSESMKKQGIKIHRNNPANTNGQFASLVNSCRAMICSDSFSLHLSIALNKPTIGLFFCTPPDEVESYNVLEKLVSPRLNEFFPEKMDQYDEELVKSISAELVLSKIIEII